MDLGKIKQYSGILAIISFIWFNLIMISANVFGLSFMTGGDLEATIVMLKIIIVLLICLFLTFIVSTAIWAVLMFTDYKAWSSQKADTEARNKIIAVSLSTSLLSGLFYYTPYFFVVTLALPFILGSYISSRIETVIPVRRKMAYYHLSVLLGTVLGYIIATAYFWNDLTLLHGSANSNLDLFFKSLSVFKIFYFIWLYLFFGWLDILKEIFRKKFNTYSEEPWHQYEIYRCGMNIVLILVTLTASLVIISQIGFGQLCWPTGGIVSIVSVILIFLYIIRILKLFDR